MKTVNLVATDQLIGSMFSAVEPHSRQGRPGIRSADFQVDPAKCRSRLSRWLADNLVTTVRDDDMSVLRLHLAMSEEALHLRRFGEFLSQVNPTTEAQAQAILQQMAAFSAERQKIYAAYGEVCFNKRVIEFDWPVLGSRAAEHVSDPVAYFDLCAARIRALRPEKIKLHCGGLECPPEFLN